MRCFRNLPLQEQIMGEWTFFSNHGHVLVCLSRDREARLRDVAVQVGITERAVQKIVRDMQDAGYLEVTKHGRRNRYRINNRKALRHQLQSGCTIGQLLRLLGRKLEAGTSKPDESQLQPQVQMQDAPEELVKPEPDHPVPDETVRVEPEPVAPDPESMPVQLEPVEAEPVLVEPDPVEPEPDSQSEKKPEKADLEQGQLF